MPPVSSMAIVRIAGFGDLSEDDNRLSTNTKSGTRPGLWWVVSDKSSDIDKGNIPDSGHPYVELQ